jgi:acetylornithine/N-succinyldiaminopimelate aminotransferase
MGRSKKKKHPFPQQYAEELLVLESGRGCYVKDVTGTKYLDFGAGIAVNALGYGRRDLARVASRQMKKLIHVSNLYTTSPALEFGQTLMDAANRELTGTFSAVHFGSSGAEATESALKYARLYARERRGEGHHKVLSFSHSFHGRTMGALSVTANRKYRLKFEPLLPGAEYAPFNDVEALQETLDGSFAAVIVEVVQGEGGLEVMTDEFAEALNRLCADKDVLLIADEVQSGLGRTGHLFASQMVGLTPDILNLSKPLAGGLPLSATILPQKVNRFLHTGDHGTTFGGGPVTSAVGLEVWKQIGDPSFLEEVKRNMVYLNERLEALRGRFPFIEAVVGAGMLRGLRLSVAADQASTVISDALAQARQNRLLVLKSGERVIRIAPPLVISSQEIDDGCERLAKALQYIQEEHKGALE